MQSNNFFSLEQVIDRHPLQIVPDLPLTEVIRLMHEWGNSCYLSEDIDRSETSSLDQINNSCALVVVDSQLKGIFSERDLVHLVANGTDISKITVEEVMNRELITLTLTGSEDIFTALNLLRQHHIRHLPIIDDRHRLWGLVTEKNIRQNLQPMNLMKWRRVEEIMNTSVVNALPTASVRQVARLMATHKVSCVAIVEEREQNGLLVPIGIITERDIVQFQNLSLDLSQPAQKLMSSPLFLISPQDNLWSVHQLMKQRRVRRLLVAGDRGELAGIITQSSLLQVFDPTEMYGLIEELQQKVCQLEIERAEFLQNRTTELEQQVRTELNQRQQVETTKQHLTSILEATTDFVGMVDVNGRTLYLNQAGRKMMGFGEEEDLSNLTVPDYCAPWAVKVVQEGMLNAMREGVWSGETALLNRDGREIAVSQVIIAHKESNRSVTSFSTIIRDISDRKKIEADLKYRVEFEQLIARIATRFINLTSAEINREIKYALRVIGEFTQVDTSYVFQISDELKTMSMNYEWVKPDLQANIQQAQNLPLALFPWSIAQLQRGEIVHVPSVANLPPEADIDRQNWQKFNLFSLIFVPLMCQSIFSGWIGFANFSEEKVWSESSINLLKIISEMFANALHRQQVEQALRESEQRFDRILSSLEDVVWSIEPHTFETLYINSAVAKIYGRPVAEFYDNPHLWLEVVHPEDRDRVNNMAQNMSETEVSEIKYRIVRPDGEIRWLYERARLIRDSNGEAIRLDGITTDISDLQRREEILKDIASGMTVKIGENFLPSLVEYLSKTLKVDYAFVGELIEPEADTIKTLAVYAKGNSIENFEYHLAGAPCENVIKQKLCIYPEAVRQSFPQDLLLQEMGVESYAGLTICDSPKRTFGLIAILDSKPFDDIVLIEEVLKIFATRVAIELERQQAEAKIRQQAALLDVATDAIIVRGLDNQILFWNRGAEKLYGWTQAEAIERDADRLLYREFSTELDEIRQAVTEKGEWQGELKQVNKTGRDIVVESRWTLVKDSWGNPQSFLVVNTDVTEKKQLEKQFLRAQRLESLGTLAGGIAHDLNNIFTPILAVTQILPRRLPGLDKNLQELLNICQNNVRRGADLVKQILTFTRGAEGEKGIIQVKHLIREIQQIAKETFPKTIEIQTNVSKNLWAVKGNATQLHQVLMNLSVNGRDAMANGGKLEISAENFVLDRDYARMYLDAHEGHYILITVSDTGVGIPADIKERVFEPFFTTKEIGQGTGLGLSTVLGIVKSHGGFIDIHSQVGRGSKFRVFLPASETAATVTEEIEELPRGNGELILVVDDEAPIRAICKNILETYNYRVLSARDGIEAIALYSQHQNEIEVVLMDIMMPSIDGKVAIRTLKKIKPQVKIIAVSGLVTKEIGSELKDYCFTFLAKPYTTEALLKTIHQAIEY